jgi:hypothetical protein
MTENHIWLNQQHTRFRDEIKRSGMSFAMAQECRSDISLLWNDACAREVNGRFLDKIADQGAASLNALELQHEMLTICAGKLANADRSFLAATKASEQLHGHIEDTAVVLRTIQSYLDRSVIEVRTAMDHVTKAHQLARAADEAGNSAAPRRRNN